MRVCFQCNASSVAFVQHVHVRGITITITNFCVQNVLGLMVTFSHQHHCTATALQMAYLLEYDSLLKGALPCEVKVYICPCETNLIICVQPVLCLQRSSG